MTWTATAVTARASGIAPASPPTTEARKRAYTMDRLRQRHCRSAPTTASSVASPPTLLPTVTLATDSSGRPGCLAHEGDGAVAGPGLHRLHDRCLHRKGAQPGCLAKTSPL